MSEASNEQVCGGVILSPPVHVFTPDGKYLGLLTASTFEDEDLDRWESEGGR